MTTCAEQSMSKYLRDELESNGRVDGYIAAYSEADEGSEDKESLVVVCAPETHAEDRGDETGQVEGPSAAWKRSENDVGTREKAELTYDVGQNPPDEGASRHASVEARANVARLVAAEAQLLLQRTENQPKGLRP